MSREFQYYNIVVTVTASPIVDTLTFECRAREMAQREIIIKNPLADDADFYIRCERLQCPEVLKINGNSEATLTMTYSPLVVGDIVDYLEVTNFLVGTLVYEVILKCLPAKEKNVEHETALGTNIPIRLRVQNRSEFRADFTCMFSHPSVLPDKEYVLGPLDKGKFLVLFEPTEPGIQHCKISFDSPIAGEFIYNLKGTGTRPKPQGPYQIKAGDSTYILFKNVFSDVCMFKIYVDRNEFYVNAQYELLRSKKDVKIEVSLTDMPSAGWKEMPTGTLTIQTHEPSTPKVLWTYFLQGIVDPKP